MLIMEGLELNFTQVRKTVVYLNFFLQVACTQFLKQSYDEQSRQPHLHARQEPGLHPRLAVLNHQAVC